MIYDGDLVRLVYDTLSRTVLFGRSVDDRQLVYVVGLWVLSPSIETPLS